MKCYPESVIESRRLIVFTLIASMTLPLSSQAAPVALATEPMATTTSSVIKPNIMYVLDDSGSMDYAYLPDWVKNSHPGLGTPYTNIPQLFNNGGFNGVAYNPAITYMPPVYYNADGTLNTTLYPNIGSPWTSVKNDAYSVQDPTGTRNLVGNASYYYFTPGEYCTSPKLTSCTPSSVPTGSYTVAAGLRWCKDTALTSCQAINTSTYINPRFPGQTSAARIAWSWNNGTTRTVTGITVNSQQILSATASGTDQYSLSVSVAANINACTVAKTGGCGIAGYSAAATPSGAVIIFAPAALSPMIYLSTVSGTATPSQNKKFDGAPAVPGSNTFVNVVSTNNSYVKAAARTDCAGATCSYAEEMTNYANWWTYYHTRMQAMKTSVSRAFQSLNQNYRVGFTTISDKTYTSTNFISVDTFQTTQKNSWFTKLLKTPIPSGATTPLRGALAKAGQYYGHTVASLADPLQYSCQQNFTILSTDGYWNSMSESPANNDICVNGTSSTGDYGAYQLDNKTCVGNLDGSTSLLTNKSGMYDAKQQSSTLADVAKYYYDNDLRTTNCTGALNLDVCENNVYTSSTDTQTKQHMTTFTVGLGADGLLQYTSDYATATSGDFYDLKNGLGSPTVVWPDPINGTGQERIDDLWHAAVNGHGAYFSAKNPDDIVTGFNKALSAISSKLGSAAAAGTSTLTPTTSNDFAFLASYTTVSWKGNLEARTIDLTTGAIAKSASWCVEDVVGSTCATTPVADTSVSPTAYYCVPAGTNCNGANGSCAGVSPMTSTCTGTMAGRVSANSDTRTIYTANSAGNGLIPFDSTITATYPALLANISNLTQWTSINQTAAKANLVNFLRGQYGYEDRSSNPPPNRLYRAREAVTGDVNESQPAFIAAPTFNYSYPGYQAWKTGTLASRRGTVYVGTNDGMLHAYVGQTASGEVGGTERWAYVPSMVIPNLYKLADESYSTMHARFVNSSPIISDICTASCDSAANAVWKTILVGGLGGGGRGYYALDITNPTAPALLWEFSAADDADLGYSFSRPVVTRKSIDGKWVVVFASGYDNGTDSSTLKDPSNPALGFVPNSPAGSGGGFLFVLDAASGTPISKIPTGMGTAAAPSGLGQIAIWNNNVATGNDAGNVYAGDLLGNVWRFDIETTPSPTPLLFATLKNAAGQAQPVTTTPQTAMLKNKYPVVFIGTGKYLESNDLKNADVQSMYAIKDDGTPVGNPRSHTGSIDGMVQQTITTTGVTRTGTSNPVDFSKDRGWFFDFPDKATTSPFATERVNIDIILSAGTLYIATIVPSTSTCAPGGYSWLTQAAYDTGAMQSVRSDTVIVGMNEVFTSTGGHLDVIDSGGNASQPPLPPTKDPTSSNFTGTRSIWREVK